MSEFEAMEQELAQLGRAGLINPEASHIDSYDGEVVVEAVVRDGARAEEVRRLLQNIIEKNGGPGNVTILVRKNWIIDSVGEPVPAYGPDGRLRAASLVPVELRAGSERVLVTVSVTKLAEMTLEEITGKQQSQIQRLAEMQVATRLHRSGLGYWNPEKENYLEIASASVPNLVRLIQRAA